MEHVRVISTYEETRNPALRKKWNALLDEHCGETLFYQSAPYFDHLAHREPREAVFLAVLEDDHESTSGIVPLWLGEAPLEFRVRSARVAKWSFNGLMILGGNLLLPQSPASFRSLFDGLFERFPDCALLEIKGVPISSPLWRFLTETFRGRDDYLLYTPHGPRSCHSAVVPRTFEEYLGRFKRKKRYNLKRQVARLRAHAGDTLDLRRIETPAEVPVLLESLDVLAPSWRTSGRVMSPAEFLDLADRGLLLSYVLQSEAGPLSLAIGTRFGDTQLVHRFAYDHALEHLSPGTVLQTLMMEDLIVDRLAARIDYGVGEPKYRLANDVDERVNVMLVRNTALNRSAILAHAAFGNGLELIKRLTLRRPESMS